jgi:hypothetical protein
MLSPWREGEERWTNLGNSSDPGLHRQGLKVAAIARQLSIDRKTVRKYLSRGLV